MPLSLERGFFAVVCLLFTTLCLSFAFKHARSEHINTNSTLTRRWWAVTIMSKVKKSADSWTAGHQPQSINYHNYRIHSRFLHPLLFSFCGRDLRRRARGAAVICSNDSRQQQFTVNFSNVFSAVTRNYYRLGVLYT